MNKCFLEPFTCECDVWCNCGWGAPCHGREDGIIEFLYHVFRARHRNWWSVGYDMDNEAYVYANDGTLFVGREYEET